MSTGSGLNNNEKDSKVSDSASFSFVAFPSRSLDFSGLATVKTKKRSVSDKGLELLEDLNEVNILNVAYVITLFSWDNLKV